MGDIMKMKMMAAAAAMFACAPGVALAQDFDGARIEARIGYETPTVSGDDLGDEDVYKIGSAVSYGGEIGFDLRASDKVVVGPYANYEFSNVEACDGPDCLQVDGNLSVGGRIGFAVSPTVQIFAKAGYANITLSADTSFGDDSESKGGIQGAIGAAMNFTPNAYGMVEFSYADYGDLYGINLQRRHVAAGVGFRF